MQTAGVALPYWENAARLVENDLAFLLLAIVLTALLPLGLLVFNAVRLVRRGWLALRWEVGPRLWERAADRVRAKQQIALKKRQKRIESRWLKEDEAEEKDREEVMK